MKNLQRKILVVDKIFYKYLLLDVKFNIIITVSSAFLLGACLQKHTLLTFSIATLCTLAMATVLYKSIKLANRQKKLMDEIFKEQEHS